MASNEEETQRVARRALEELVKIREDKVQSLERQLAGMDAHVQHLMETYAIPAFPVGKSADHESTPKRRKIEDMQKVEQSSILPVEDHEVNVEKEARRLSFSCLCKRQSKLDAFFQPYDSGDDAARGALGATPVPFVMSRREVPSDMTMVVSGPTSAATLAPGPKKEDSRVVVGSEIWNAAEGSVVTWKPKARPVASSSSSGSSENSGSVSADTQGGEVEEEATSLKQSLTTSAKKQRPCVLTADATSDDHFDWMSLGALTSILWPDRCVVGHHQQVPQDRNLPLKFQSEAQYAATFQPLIMEESRAIFQSDWEKLRKDLGVRRTTTGTYRLSSAQGAGLWHLQHLPNQDGPFCSVQGYQQQSGPGAEHCEVVLLACRKSLELKALALVHTLFDDGALLRTREVWENCPEQCFMLKVSNLITMKRMYTAVSSLSVLYSPLRSQVLNPCSGNSTLSTGPAFLSAWAAEGLFNSSQLSAISAAVNLRQGFLLVQGPPGTGKTTTIVGMVSALLIKEPGLRILLCAGSNPALDEVVSRLMHGMVDSHGKKQPPSPGVIVRVGPKHKVRKDCLDAYLDHVRLRQTEAPNKSLATEWTLKTASIVCSTLSGSRHPQLDDLKFNFNVVIVDEAAQAAEPEVIIALKKVADRCILVGDPRQLPATVIQQKAATAFGRSLFERMQEAGVPVHLLRTQYRMHPDISKFPSRQFYDNVLEDSEQVQRMKPIFQFSTRHQWVASGGYDFELGRLCFLDVTWGSHQRDKASSSLLNREEASVVAAIVRGVLSSLVPGVKIKVGVITPYAAQKKTILDELSRVGVEQRQCEVDTVDGFQGREKDVVIVSCVRAGSHGGMGFLSDPRRVCVALTRAKHALIIVGHARTLEKHQLWRSLIRHAYDRNCFKALLRSRLDNRQFTK